uniref:Uncharacterized protein TCIL3000_11_2680 n=1 Tax=Trypanosoma congolense (strain IL3000) TaxID=1068625 RepID=G0UZQ7_TRYCI|nr:unnamed protein product [Trypanosoma congolense IL3000]
MSGDHESEFVEVFGFLHNSRDDVRKMAVQGLAHQSKDNKQLFAFLASSTHGPRCIDALLQFLHAGSVTILGDILTILINCSADGTCTEALVTRKVVRKAMRLLDNVENSDHPQPLQRGFEEMTLMLLSNLTAGHVSAAEDLLQVADEDLRGFYIGKLHTYYSRFDPDDDEQDGICVNGSEANIGKSQDEQDAVGGGGRNRRSDSTQTERRDLQRWILQILLNVTRTLDGQQLLLEDEDWLATLTDCLSSANTRHRLLAAQCFRNCSLQQQQHARLLRGRCLHLCVERLGSGCESVPEVEMLLAEIVANLMGTEAGMEVLEELNAKRHLQSAVAEGKVRPETQEFLTQHVLPLLDDIVDAYVMSGADVVD